MRRRVLQKVGLVAAIVVSIVALRLVSGEKPAGNPTLGKTGNNMEKATFGAGCFWGVEAAYRQIKGVSETRVGYAGGSVKEPSYKQVCSDRTGHAEVVEVTFDPSIVDYRQLVDLFWKVHDPTQFNRQGPDVGSQYRSVIFFHGEEQEKEALASLSDAQSSGVFGKRIVTSVEPAPEFWAAEDYHQQYLEKRGAKSCHLPAWN